MIARRGNSGKAAGGGIEGAPKQKQMTKAVQERFGVAAKASTILLRNRGMNSPSLKRTGGRLPKWKKSFNKIN